MPARVEVGKWENGEAGKAIRCCPCDVRTTRRYSIPSISVLIAERGLRMRGLRGRACVRTNARTRYVYESPLYKDVARDRREKSVSTPNQTHNGKTRYRNEVSHDHAAFMIIIMLVIKKRFHALLALVS